MGGDRINRVESRVLLPTTSFTSQRINQSIFLVIEDDTFGEQPYIFIKIYPNHILITDTGCNAPRKLDRAITSLRDYIEQYPLPSNKNLPLNPDGEKNYIIICSHCHYDHILGLPHFSTANPTIIASNFDKEFLLKGLPKHSLCKYLDVPTPKYKISLWAGHMEYLVIDHVSFRIQFLHVPGHTPDSLAWYDIDERHLYVGDTFYERMPETSIPGLPSRPSTAGSIIIPNEGGDLIQYMASLELLLSFVEYHNNELLRQHVGDEGAAPRVKVGCGHLTHSADAEEMMLEVQALFGRIIAGKVPVSSTTIVRGAITDFWLESKDARYSVRAPRRLVEKARKHFGVGPK